MDEVARVVLALEDHDVAEEVMHFLDRSGRARVVATATDPGQLTAAVRQLEPDAVLAQPSLLAPGSVNGSSLIAVDTRESVASLRAAIRAGAHGFYVWPSEREQIAGAAARTRVSVHAAGRRGRVVGVWSPRGGAGTTFVATHLAAAFARKEIGCLLLDADLSFGDVAPALGVPPDPKVAGLAELLSLGEESNHGHVRDATYEHPEGFGVLLAPGQAHSSVDRRALERVMDLAATCSDHLVVHMPRALDEGTLAIAHDCDRLLVVLSLDVLGFRAGSRAMSSLDLEQDRISFVVNRAARGEVTPSDVQKVFGTEPIAVIPRENAVPRAQDRGILMPPRSRIGRTFDRLATRLAEEGT
jgi:Flp pilus assembly CpaE family ATPase